MISVRLGERTKIPMRFRANTKAVQETTGFAKDARFLVYVPGYKLVLSEPYPFELGLMRGYAFKMGMLIEYSEWFPALLRTAGRLNKSSGRTITEVLAKLEVRINSGAPLIDSIKLLLSCMHYAEASENIWIPHHEHTSP